MSTFELVKSNANFAGLIREIKGQPHVDLKGTVDFIQHGAPDPAPGNDTDAVAGQPEEHKLVRGGTGQPEEQEAAIPQREGAAENRHVFVGHGKNVGFLPPLKKVLRYGDFVPVVATERHTVAQPVPDKVMREMRSCTAAIIHVEGEQELLDESGERHTQLNPNVLIEIGAAMALYGKRFVLLVENGVKLPSNLQGLYEVRYDGTTLDGEATLALLQAMQDVKNHELPALGVKPSV